MAFFLVFTFIVLLQFRKIYCEITSGRIKGEDEPRMVSWKVLQGVTEPFDSLSMNNQDQENIIPIWKQMKNAADHKAASLAIQQALHEYGQLIRHPYMFGEMPMEERYDVFLSMSKLLKMMGFYQKSELLLYEAMSYTINPHEAHLQLGLLYLDKEDLEKAKLHLKNCLFFKESDILILIHLSTILIAEGKYHEAQYFLSRVLVSLEQRVNTLSFMISKKDINDLKTNRIDYRTLSNWIEDLLVKVFYGEFRVTPSTTIDMLKLFSNLYQWLAEGEISGRFLFDLGQSLYEGGRPYIGKLMMSRGFATSNAEVEGVVSTQVVTLRLAFDFPLVPESLLNIVEIYLNMTQYLSDSSQSYEMIDFENVVDIYWPLPLLAWSGLPVMSVYRELLWRFTDRGRPIVRKDEFSKYWLANNSYDDIINHYHPGSDIYQDYFVSTYTGTSKEKKSVLADINAMNELDLEDYVVSFDKIQLQHRKVMNGIRTVVVPPGEKLKPKPNPKNPKTIIEVGILGGHMNNHPVGQMIYRRFLALNMVVDTNKNQTKWNEYIHITLLALPLIPDRTTNRIASATHKVVNLPIDMLQAWKIIESLHFDVIIFPDWQPFPDVQSPLFQTRRIAPVQICVFVRGSSCISDTIDYYLMPSELQNTYMKETVAADINSKVTLKNYNVRNDNTSTTMKTHQKSLRPLWKESYVEQIVLLDWPIITTQVIRNVAHNVDKDDALNMNNNLKGNQQPSSSSSSGSSSSSHQNKDALFSPLEIEGKIFFEGQPVAVIPFYPMYVHPIMDETIFKIMRAVPSLHVVLALSETLFTGTKDDKHKMSWARRLVRRMWDRGGNLFQRIRLLPTPLNDKRMYQLFRQADMILDSFPIGGSFYYLSLATSVGTPVITMQSGTLIETPKEDLKDIRSQLLAHKQHSGSSSGVDMYRGNPLYHYAQHFDLPWLASSSAINGFYDRIQLSEYFVANSTANYFTLACNLALNREFAYSLRVKLLEAVDSYKFVSNVDLKDDDLNNNNIPPPTTTRHSAAQKEKHHTYKASVEINDNNSDNELNISPTIVVTETVSNIAYTFAETEDEWGDNSDDIAAVPIEVTTHNNNVISDNNESSSSTTNNSETLGDCGHCVDDLGRFLLTIATPFAKARLIKQQQHSEQQQKQQYSSASSQEKNKKKKRGRVTSKGTETDDKDDSNYFGGSGAIS